MKASGLTASMEALVEALKKFPGVGPRTAERFAFFLLTQPASVARTLAQSILRVKEQIGFCKLCYNLADEETCTICRDQARDRSLICVVEHPRAIVALEKAGGYKGVYHVLLGALSPLDGIGPRDLKIQELKARIREGVREVILATDSDLEGETTSLYLAKELKAAHLGTALKITRLGLGLPMGSTIEYADQMTLTRALEGRRGI